MGFLGLSEDKLMHIINDKFDKNYFIDGQKGVARFTFEELLKDTKGKLRYICVNPSRNIFAFKIFEGNMVKDIGAKKLTKSLIKGAIIKRAKDICDSIFIENNKYNFIVEIYNNIKDIKNNNYEFVQELKHFLIYYK